MKRGAVTLSHRERVSPKATGEGLLHRQVCLCRIPSSGCSAATFSLWEKGRCEP